MTWQENAACTGQPLDLFFPVEKLRARDPYAAGRALCESCPVRDACLTTAMAEEPRESRRYGLRGGLTPDQRATLVRKARRYPSNDYGITLPPLRTELRPLTIDNTNTRKELHAKGLNDVAAAHQLGIHTSTFQEWRIRQGLSPNTRGGHRTAIHELRIEMHASGKSDKTIGEATGTSRSAITKWRANHRLQANDRSTA